MRVDAWLAESTSSLTNAGVGTARLDCLVLLEDATGKDRAWLLAHPEFTVQGSTLHNLKSWVKRRIKHEPLAYVRGKSEFYGREFIVNAHTLEPRPESETIISLLKQTLEDRSLKMEDGRNIVDIGTGSGCLAVTAKLEMPHLNVYATDIDQLCIKTAKENAKNLQADVTFYSGDLLDSLPSSIFQLPTSILANLPYVPNAHTINQAAMFEPKHAIFGGPDGLDIYRRFFVQVTKLALKPNYILTESLPFQHKELVRIAKISGYKLQKTADFIQAFNQSSLLDRM